MYMLRRHPFEVGARFGHCLVLTYAFPRQVLQPLLPPGLELDTLDDLGFLAVAIVETFGLRPRVLPRWTAADFILAGYRVFIRHRDSKGRRRRGLFILESGTDSRRMALLGNLLTHYNYRKVEADLEMRGSRLYVDVRSRDGTSDLAAWADLDAQGWLPPGSPFPDERQARRFAGPMPYTFSHEPETGAILRIRGVRGRWRPQMVRASVQINSFLLRRPFAQARPALASAFHLNAINYRWEKAVVERRTPCSPSTFSSAAGSLWC